MSKSNTDWIVPVIVVGGIYLIVTKVGNIFGGSKLSAADQQKVDSALKTINKQTAVNMPKLTNNDVFAIAKTIYDALGTWQNDREDEVYSALRTIPTKADLWRVDQYFQNAYHLSVIDHMRSHLDDNEMLNVAKIIGDLN